MARTEDQAGHIDSTAYDTNSIPKLVTWRFGLKPLLRERWKFDGANALDLLVQRLNDIQACLFSKMLSSDNVGS